MSLPSISVITPSFNQGQFIQQTVESVLTQGYPNLEYIVMDGGSTDTTLTVLEPYRSRITLISEKDHGQTDAINKGLRRATGEIICWLNSDDYFLPGALQTIGDYFAQYTTTQWLTADCLIVDEAGQRIQRPIQRYKKTLRGLTAGAYLGMTNAICQPSTFWRRSVHDRIGYLDESLRYTMDYDFWLRLAQDSVPAVLDVPVAAFRIHSQSKGGAEYVKQFMEDEQTLRRHMRSAPVRWLHRRHNQLIIGIYRLLK